MLDTHTKHTHKTHTQNTHTKHTHETHTRNTHTKHTHETHNCNGHTKPLIGVASLHKNLQILAGTFLARATKGTSLYV